jgi:hypothetical protein
MYEKAVAFLQGDRSGVMAKQEIHRLLAGWTRDGYEPWIARDLP